MIEFVMLLLICEFNIIIWFFNKCEYILYVCLLWFVVLIIVGIKFIYIFFL